MCLAVAPNKQSSNGVLSRIWRNVSATPFRLLTICALAHTLILGGLFLRDVSANHAFDTHTYMFALSFGILALFGFGYLLTWLPRKYSLSPVHYARYNSIYLFMMTGLLVLETGIIFGGNWAVIGMLLLIPAWLIALQSLWNLHIWMNAGAQKVSRLMMLLVSLNFIYLNVSVLGPLFNAESLPILATTFSTVLVWPGFFIATLVLIFIAPAKGRIISL